MKESVMPECGNTFDGKHHYRPRTFGSAMAGNARNVLACACGKECPPEERAGVEAALRETDLEKERQRFPLRRPGENGYGEPPRYIKARLPL